MTNASITMQINRRIMDPEKKKTITILRLKSAFTLGIVMASIKLGVKFHMNSEIANLNKQSKCVKYPQPSYALVKYTYIARVAHLLYYVQ